MRIRTKIFLATVVTSTAFMLTAAVLDASESLEALRQEKARRELAVTRATAAVLSEAVITADPIAARAILDRALATEEGLEYAYVTGMDGVPLADTFEAAVPSGLIALGRSSAEASWTVTLLDTERGLIEDSAYRLFAYGPAVLHMGFDRRSLEEESARAIRRHSLLFAAFVITFTLVLYLVERKIVGPIERLTQAVGTVDFDRGFAPVEIESDDEVGVLARAFNETGFRLASQFQALRDARQASKALARKVMQTQEDERCRVANDVHDSLMAQLASLRYWLEGLKDPAGLSGPDARERLGEFKTLLDAAIGSGRELIADLRPPLLDILGLEAALRDHVTAGCERADVVCTFESEALPDLDEDFQVGVFRVVQEALANALKHSLPNVVTVALEVHQDRLWVTVQDDGSGFDPREVTPAEARVGGHLGLAAMRERVEILGGTITVDSTRGGGTTVRAVFPLGEASPPGRMSGPDHEYPT